MAITDHMQKAQRYEYHSEWALAAEEWRLASKDAKSVGWDRLAAIYDKDAIACELIVRTNAEGDRRRAKTQL